MLNKQNHETLLLLYLKALWRGQGKIKMHYGMSLVKKQLSGKRSIGLNFRGILINCKKYWPKFFSQ